MGRIPVQADDEVVIEPRTVRTNVHVYQTTFFSTCLVFAKAIHYIARVISKKKVELVEASGP